MQTYKYGNKPICVDGLWFQSIKESNHWQELQWRQRAGEITNLQRQVRFHFDMEGERLWDYIADFVYTDTRTGALHVVDVKGYRKGLAYESFKRNKILMRLLHKIVVEEV